jgi:hypothetical protein
MRSSLVILIPTYLLLSSIGVARTHRQASTEDDQVAIVAVAFMVQSDLGGRSRVKVAGLRGTYSDSVPGLGRNVAPMTGADECTHLSVARARANCALRNADGYVDVGPIETIDDSTRSVAVTTYQADDGRVRTYDGMRFLIAKVEVVRRNNEWRATRLLHFIVP